nr:putative ribonuclease H-like domain-containing protein [Tanacetum cinerariifolium]
MVIEGVVQPIASTTAKQRLARKNELQAHGTLLMALPDKHQLKFNIHKDAKTLMEAIKKRSLSASLKFVKNLSQEDINLKFLRSLPTEWRTHILIWRNKTDLEEQSLNDLFNNLKIYKAKVKNSSSASTSTQNIAFVSSCTTDSTNEPVSATASISAVSAKLPVAALPNVDTLSNAVIYSFFASKSNTLQLDNEDLKQIDADDLKEIDLKWQMAMLIVRARQFLQRIGKNLRANGPTSMGFDMSKVECYNCHRKGHFARECSYDWSFQAEEEPTNYALMAFISSSSSSDNESDESLTPSPIYDRYQSGNGYHDVSPSYTGTFMPPKPDLVFYNAPNDVETVHTVFNVKLSPTKPENDLSHTHRPSAPIIEDWVSNSEAIPKHTSNGNHRNRKACFVCKSLDHLIKDCDYHEKKLAQTTDRNHAPRGHHKHYASMPLPNPQRYVVPTAVVPTSKLVPINAARPFTATVPNINVTRPRQAKSIVTKPNSLPRQPINCSPSPKASNFPPKVTAVKVSQMCDEKNKVLFTDTECLVLSLEFKLPDENQVQLRVPRENNMYNVNLKTIVPSGDLTCLFAKETLDESNLWYRRLAHINFKTINKLVKGNLVRGLPTKVFENDHTCVPCKNEKQHKASCKTKPVSSVNQPLQRRHMYLFGPTFVKSLNKKSYYLVVTDDYSIENQLSLKVKIIRSDNRTKFKNNDPNQFCGMKGIKREFSVPRTPQQYGIAERKNRTPIEAARTMLADSLLPIPFWAEAVNTACYVQNRVLVTKPQNKTPYELLHGQTPSIGFMRPFCCLVTILNTLDSLGKFDGKVDERFLVGYSVSSKSFRVFNSRTRIIQETLHINFLENKPNVAGSGPTWLFDIDILTMTMNYQPVTVGNQSNPSAGVQEQFDTEKIGEEIVQQYVLFPVWSSGSTNPQNTDGDAAFNKKEPEFEGRKPESEVNVSLSSSAQSKKHNDKTKREAKGKSPVESLTRYRNLSVEIEDFFDNNINKDNAVGTLVPAVGQLSLNSTNTFSAAGPSNAAASLTHRKSLYVDSSQLHDDPNMSELKDITYFDYEDDVGAEADFNNLKTSITVSPIPTTRVHKDHPVTQIIEPKRVHQALKDPSWIEAMREELLQLKMQKEEGIDYEEVFAPVVRMEAIRLFLAYASFMGFMVYQIDVKSTFLYGTIEEEDLRTLIILTRFTKWNKALYGLHQAPRAWQKCDILLVHIYVDDIIFGSTNKDLCKAFKKIMKDKFQMSSMGELTFFLGLQVKQKKDGIFIS